MLVTILLFPNCFRICIVVQVSPFIRHSSILHLCLLTSLEWITAKHRLSDFENKSRNRQKKQIIELGPALG